MWQRITQDFRERFLNFETAKGMYLVPFGLIAAYVTLFYIQYVIQVFGLGASFYMVYEGFRKIFVNRTKQQLAQEELVAARLKPEGNDA